MWSYLTRESLLMNCLLSPWTVLVSCLLTPSTRKSIVTNCLLPLRTRESIVMNCLLSPWTRESIVVNCLLTSWTRESIVTNCLFVLCPKETLETEATITHLQSKLTWEEYLKTCSIGRLWKRFSMRAVYAHFWQFLSRFKLKATIAMPLSHYE